MTTIQAQSAEASNHQQKITQPRPFLEDIVRAPSYSPLPDANMFSRPLWMYILSSILIFENETGTRLRDSGSTLLGPDQK